MSAETGSKAPRKQSYRVKPRSRDASNKFVKLKAMKCFKEVHQRILDNWPLSQVAKFIQHDRKEYNDVTTGSLVAVLQEYRGSIPPIALLSKTPMLPTFGKAMDEVTEGLDELAELERLYRIQMERIEIDFEKEKQIKKLLTTMTPEIRAAKDILQARSQLKMDLGLNDRHLGTAEVDVTVTSSDMGSKYGENVKKVLENDGSRRKLLGLADRVMALAASKRSDQMGEETLAKLAEDIATATHLPPSLEALQADEETPNFDFDRDPDSVEETGHD